MLARLCVHVRLLSGLLVCLFVCLVGQLCFVFFGVFP